MASARRPPAVPRRPQVRESPPAPEAVSPRPRAAPLLLFDTNVVLDVVLGRTSWAESAALLLDLAVRGEVRGYVAAHAVTTIHCVVEREAGRQAALTAVGDLLDVLDVVELGSADFQRALALGLRDYEDAVQAAASLRIGARYLVTRNERDFQGAPVVARSAAEVLALVGAAPS